MEIIRILQCDDNPMIVQAGIKSLFNKDDRPIDGKVNYKELNDSSKTVLSEPVAEKAYGKPVGRYGNYS